jgi:hypothetical protein
MKATEQRVRGRVAGLVAAVALAAGGVAAAVAGTPAHATAVPAEHAAGTHDSALAVEAKASLLQYLKRNRGWNIPAPGGGPHKVTPSTTNLGVSAQGSTALPSYNWSGYYDSGATGTFTSVSATWAQPATLCTPEQRLTAFWVGLDGALATDQTVEQDGTLAYCFQGQAYYYTWWEVFPGSSVTVGSTVQPGDMISASVTRSGTSYTLSLSDSSTPGNSFSTTQTCAAGTCLDQSAEWIAERPAFPIGITPLAYFNVWAPFNASQTANGTKGGIASGPGATSVVMVDATDTYPLDSVSGLSSGGASFTAHWLNSY